jgi:excisionase family DNA binding protein
MKITHEKEMDYLSIDFEAGIEAKSEYSDGIIVRYNKRGHVLGIDITDSLRLFANSDLLSLNKACQFLGISQSTLRRYIKGGKVKYSMKGKDYRFRKTDLVKLVA